MARRMRWQSIVRDDRGSSLVEFAIGATLLLIAFFGVIDFSRALYAYHFVSYAAQEGSRYAMVRGNDWPSVCAAASSYDCQASSANIRSYVQGLTPPGISASNLTVTPGWPGVNADDGSVHCNTSNTQNSQGCMVKVTVAYAFNFMLPFLPKSGLTMTAASEQAIAY